MKLRISICMLMVAAVMTCAPSILRAQTGEGPSSGNRSQWRAMHQEMLAACVDKSAAAACSVSLQGRTVSGTCRANRRGRLVCRTGKGGRNRGMRDSMGGGMSSMPLNNAP